MPQRILLPTPFHQFTNGLDAVSVNALTVKEAFEQLDKAYPGVKLRLCESEDRLKRFVNVYVDGEDIRFLSHLDSALRDGSEISVILAVAGG